jgi:DNA-binding winged helix-turn-helix (wHTH) protein
MEALAAGDVFLFDGFRLDRRGGGLFRRDERGDFVPIATGARALDVLGVLVERSGDVVSRDAIMTAVWPATVVEDANLNMQIAALRRVLDDGRADASCIQTVPGRGYRFVAKVTRGAADAGGPGYGACQSSCCRSPISATTPGSNISPTASPTMSRPISRGSRICL